jgi:hypothetical protein
MRKAKPAHVPPEFAATHAALRNALKTRMQGKSCFNFKTPDPALFKDLSALTKAAYERWRKEGLV